MRRRSFLHTNICCRSLQEPSLLKFVFCWIATFFAELAMTKILFIFVLWSWIFLLSYESGVKYPFWRFFLVCIVSCFDKFDVKMRNIKNLSKITLQITLFTFGLLGWLKLISEGFCTRTVTVCKQNCCIKFNWPSSQVKTKGLCTRTTLQYFASIA